MPPTTLIYLLETDNHPYRRPSPNDQMAVFLLTQNSTRVVTDG